MDVDQAFVKAFFPALKADGAFQGVKGKVPVVQQDALENNHDLSLCYGYGNTMADTWFMSITGNPVAINPGKENV